MFYSMCDFRCAPQWSHSSIARRNVAVALVWSTSAKPTCTNLQPQHIFDLLWMRMLMLIDSGGHSSEYVHVSKATSLALAYLSFLDEVSTCSTPLQHAAVVRLWSSFFRLRARESSHGKICGHYVTLAAFTHLHMRFALPLRCSLLPRRNGRSPLNPPRPCVAWRVR